MANFLWLGCCVTLAAMPMIAANGFCRNEAATGDSHHEFQFFAGYSPASTTLIGTTTDRRFVAAGFDYSYRCWAWHPVSISFTAGAMPAAILLQPQQEVNFPNGIGVVAAHAVYGFALTPIGFTFDFGRGHAVYPFLQIDGGIVASREPIPLNIPDATALNFMFDFGGGLKWRPAHRRLALTLGYKFLHISNAFTTTVNPGVDNNVVYAGYSFLH